ncbi:MAG: lipopolysaccharide heptosyltransferase II [Planctomycetes bacterium]|nr:lipopolysaccharide heptosyltransferase II [Planctomycetota bacterium]
MCPLLRYPDAGRIAVGVPNWLGDACMATPALRAIRENYPRAHVTLVAREYVASLFEGANWYDEIVVYEKTFGSVREKAAALSRERRDLGILLSNSFRTALLFRLARVRRRVGFSRDFRGPLLTDRLHAMRAGFRRLRFPTLDSYLAILYHLGIKVRSRALELALTEEGRAGAEAFYREHGVKEGDLLVGLAPGAAFGAAKCWPPESFAAAADLFAERFGARAIVFCGPYEEETASRIVAAAKKPLLTTAGRNFGLGVFKALVARLGLLVTNDSGPRHFGAAFGVPTVTVFGPTQQELTYTHYDREIALQKDVECGPCQLRICPLDHRCMTGISPEEVFEAGRRLLGSARVPKA